MPKRRKTTPKSGSSLHIGERFVRAVDYARHLHIEKRKGSDIPYMAHLLGVASLVMGEAGHVDFPVTEQMVIAALLHDTAEDHGGALRLKDVEHNFGPDVARIVKGLSDSLVENSEQKEPWEQRKKAYIRQLKGEPPDIQLVSAADKLYNARTILDDYRQVGPDVWTRFKRGRDLQLWYFRALLKVFKKSGTNRIVDEFERVVVDLERISANEAVAKAPKREDRLKR
ncbi:MAG TPA: HD domain-containing protein [Terracidiphilus sp.]|nr:HD domain-containing protein [Terracidiphilus sp.]